MISSTKLFGRQLFPVDCARVRGYSQGMAQKLTKKRKGPGRPPSDVDWKGSSVRFLPAEQKRIGAAVKKTGHSKAEIIREGTLRLIGQFEAEGKIDLTASAS